MSDERDGAKHKSSPKFGTALGKGGSSLDGTGQAVASSSKYMSFSQVMREKEERQRQQEQRKKEMDEAEKLHPVILMRKEQGHRFVKTIPQG